ncbi:hypothetical protein Hdeb2414_s0012g00381771 [Helianthus debilis subsp. tardiflorus]
MVFELHFCQNPKQISAHHRTLPCSPLLSDHRSPEPRFRPSRTSTPPPFSHNRTPPSLVPAAGGSSGAAMPATPPPLVDLIEK